MGMDIQIKPEEVFLNEDRSWLGTRDGTLNCRSVTINSDHFDDEHIADKGAVPSGAPLVLYADGFYGPYRGDGAADANEVQTLSRTSTGGTFDLAITDPDTDEVYTAADIPATAAGFTAAAVMTAINNAVGEVVCAVTGSDGGPLTVTFSGTWAEKDVPAMVVDDTDASGGDVTIDQTTAGQDGSLDAAGNNGHLFSTTVIDKENHTLIAVALYWEGVVKYHKLPEFDTADFNIDDAWLSGVTSIRYEDAANNRIVAVPA